MYYFIVVSSFFIFSCTKVSDKGSVQSISGSVGGGSMSGESSAGGGSVSGGSSAGGGSMSGGSSAGGDSVSGGSSAGGSSVSGGSSAGGGSMSGGGSVQSGEGKIGMPNPASEYCRAQGFTSKPVYTNGVPTRSICTDETNECEEWAFYRKECTLKKGEVIGLANPAYEECQQSGFRIDSNFCTDGKNKCEVNAWARKECTLSSIFANCAINHGWTITEKGTINYCFDGKKECEVSAYDKGECTLNDELLK